MSGCGPNRGLEGGVAGRGGHRVVPFSRVLCLFIDCSTRLEGFLACQRRKGLNFVLYCLFLVRLLRTPHGAQAG